MTKKERERLVFARFRALCPDFARVPASRLIRCGDGADPPDVLCEDDAGRRIGVELVEWLDEAQIGESRAQDYLEASYQPVIKSAPRPPRIGYVWLEARGGGKLAAQDLPAFAQELHTCLWELDRDWDAHGERRSPQGFGYREFSAYPTLARYLRGLWIFGAHVVPPREGRPWIGFRARGGAYSPDTAVQALADRLAEKCGMYATLRQAERLDALYLVVYYDQAFQHNTPFDPLTLSEGVAQARARTTGCPGPFTAIYVLNALLPIAEAVRVWPP